MTTETVTRYRCVSYIKSKPRSRGHFARHDKGVWVLYRDIKPVLQEIERLRAECEAWRNGCTGKHGSQAPCVNHPETGE